MADQVEKGLQKAGISVSRPILAIICILFGIALLLFPELVGYIIGIFLLVQGIILLIEYYQGSQQSRYTRPYTAKPPPPTEPPPETPPAYPPRED